MSLTLEKVDKATEVVSIFRRDNKTSRHPLSTVYFNHNVRNEDQNHAPARGVLELHKDFLQKKNQINSEEFDDVCDMIDDEQEPELGDPLRPAYWDIKDHFDRYLKREMYLGDEPDVEFRHEFPRKKETWPGSMTLFANSGGGKTYYLVQKLLRYLRSVPDWEKRQIVYLSPEVSIDKTLEPLRAKKWEMWYTPVDVSHEAYRKSGLGAGDFYEKNIGSKLDGDDMIIVFDDYADAAPALVPMLTAKYNSCLRVARHRNCGIVSLQHTYSGGKKTSQSLQSNSKIVMFPTTSSARCVRFLVDHLQLKVKEAKALVRRFASLDRHMVISMFSPVCIYNSKYLHLL